MAVGPHDGVRVRLIALREALGYTQTTMGRFCSIGPKAWNNYEEGRRRISIDQAVKVCIATGVTLDWIYRGEAGALPGHVMMKLQGLARKRA